MNIKSLGNIFSPTPVIKRSDVANRLKPDEGGDRDANGQTGGEQEPEKRKLSQEELDLAVKHLKELSGVRGNNLQVTVQEQNGMRVVFIEDPTGKVIRRIPEWELLPLLKARQNSTGQLLNKAL